MKKKQYHVEVLNYGTLYPEWNDHFDFDNLEKAFAYCKELDFQGKEFDLTAQYVYLDE